MEQSFIIAVGNDPHFYKRYGSDHSIWHGSKQCFRLCAWGLVKTEDYAGFEDHRQYDRNSYEYQLIVEKDQAEWVEQVVSSPDGKYILYVERIYRGTGTTDDEDVYYKVYSVDDDVSTTIFSGFRQFLLVDWK